MKITVKDDKVYVKAYYNANFVRAAHKLGGKWSDPYWVFAITEIDDVRKICIKYYGTDRADCETVTLIVHDYTEEKCRCGLSLYGIPIVKAWGRDTGAKPCDDVVVVDGDIGSGGSRVNWTTYAYHATIKIKNVPVGLMDVNNDLRDSIANGSVEVIREDDALAIRDRRIEAIKVQIASLTTVLESLVKANNGYVN